MSNLSIEDKIREVLSRVHHFEDFEDVLDSSISHFRFLTARAEMNQTKVLAISKYLHTKLSNELEGVGEEVRTETLEKLNDLIRHIETKEIGEHEHLNHFRLRPNLSLPDKILELYEQMITVVYFTDLLVGIKTKLGVDEGDTNLMSIISEHSLPAWVSHFFCLCNHSDPEMSKIRFAMNKIGLFMFAVQCELDNTEHNIRDSVEQQAKLELVMKCYKLSQNMITEILNSPSV